MNPLKYIKIFNNELCPCGSNLKYSVCCKYKKTSTLSLSKKPIEIQVMEMMRGSMKKCCMHPDRINCKGRIKNAHALQNNKIINILAGNDRHVYTMDAKKKPLILTLENQESKLIVQLSKTSVNSATTETCFCDLHDNTVFSAIEKGAPDFEETNEQMKFIYAYKAFIFEYYKHLVVADAFKECFKKNPLVFKSFKIVPIYRMLQLKTQEFEPIKSHFDNEILNGTNSGVITCVIRIPEQIKFANYAYIAPDYDLNGKRIRHTIKGIMHRLTITVFPELTQSYILLSCLESEKSIYEEFFKQLNEEPLEKVKFYMSMILPIYSENIVLSSKLWNSWDEDTQNAYTIYANSSDKDAFVHGKTIGMILQNASKCKTEVDYSKRGILDLFV